ncbi:MAG: transketolase C-terminal domain-containing protein, partial [Candidatus Dojkabacteria bacterium]
KAAEELENAGKSVEVINLYSIKPLDHETVAKSLEKTGRLVTVEEHQVAGGMGSAVLESLAQHHPKLNFEAKLHGIYDHFGESGDGMELMAKYKLDLEGIGKQLTLKL